MCIYAYIYIYMSVKFRDALFINFEVEHASSEKMGSRRSNLIQASDLESGAHAIPFFGTFANSIQRPILCAGSNCEACCLRTVRRAVFECLCVSDWLWILTHPWAHSGWRPSMWAPQGNRQCNIIPL